MVWTIYCHTHIDSGRQYVGLTRYTMMHRWNQHCAQARRSKDGRSHFPNAIRKYGKDAFSHRVLEICHDLESANAVEKRWIEELGTRDPDKGFNLMRGGQHTPHPYSSPWDRPGYRAARGIISKSLWEDPTYRGKIQSTRAQTLATAGSREKLSSASKALWEDPDFRERTSDSIKKKWEDPDYAGRVVERSIAARRPSIERTRSERLSANTVEIYVCRHHGPVDLVDCYVQKPRKPGGPPRLSCVRCDKDRREKPRSPPVPFPSTSPEDEKDPETVVAPE